MAEKKKKEEEVLLVRDEKTGEISVVAGLNKDGTPKRTPANQKHAQDFLRFDRNGDALTTFLTNFYRQCKEPNRFGFYRVAVDGMEKVMEVLKDFLKDPDTYKDLLAPHKVDTSAYEQKVAQEQATGQGEQSQDEQGGQSQGEGQDGEEQQAETTEGEAEEQAQEQGEAQEEDEEQQTQGESETPAEEEVAEGEKVTNEVTNEEPDATQEQQADVAGQTQAENAPAPQLDENGFNWAALEQQWGISLQELTDSKELNNLNKNGLSNLITIHPEIAGQRYEIQARLEVKTMPDGSKNFEPHFIQKEPKLDMPYKDIEFTDADRKSLQENGNLGRVVEIVDKDTGEIIPSYISIDRQTNEITDIPVSNIKIPQKIGKTEFAKAEQDLLAAGLPLKKEIELNNKQKFTATLQVNVQYKGVEFVPKNKSLGQKKSQWQGKKEQQTGNGYAVTWAFGHLVQPALPDGYGIKGFHRENLPIIPPVFTLVPRQVRTEKGYKPDNDVVAQIKVIGRLFRDSERIIVATDAGREGELIFRYLYEYIGCATPFDRLWISSLTDKAIREGLERLECGNKYDNLYYAAKARSECDWLVGCNGTQAMTIAAGRGTYSVGRVQTPTLAMVCERYWENKRFAPEAFWQVHFAVKGMNDSVNGNGDNGVVKFTSIEKWKEKGPAQAAYEALKVAGKATVTKVERKETVQDTPLLYDLTSLQKEMNTKHGFSADKTLSVAQKLYEAKLITYPRTGSRYIPEDVFAEIPALLSTLKNNPLWRGHIARMGEPTRRSVDDTKITDHHALLITEVKPKNLSNEDMTVYNMIAGRMLEAFSGKCIKDVTTVTAECGGGACTVKGAVMKQAGWRGVYGEEKEEICLPEWQEGDTLPLQAYSLTEGKTKPKPLHTEATLLASMETAGREIEDEELRQSLKECGIGTPATRAAIIETLFAREYMVRQKKSLVPTEKGLALYSVVKNMRIANVQMTGEWERALACIEKGETDADAFRKDIETYTRQITSELLSCDKLFSHNSSDCTCPKCKGGKMQFYGKVVRCDNPACGLPVFRTIAGKSLSDGELTDLLTAGRTKLLKGFKSKQGKSFDATIVFDADFNTTFVFPEVKRDKKYPKKKK